MAWIPAGFLCSLVAMLQSASAFRVKHERRAEVAAQVAQEPESCSIPSFVFDALRSAVNGVLCGVLPGLDPQNMTLHAFKHEVDLIACTLGLEMDASVLVAGFKDAHVGELNCVHSECIQGGVFACAVTDYTFDTQITFGDRIVTGGEQSAQWELCGVTYPNHTIEIGVDSLNPGLKASIKVRATGLLDYEIREITNFETQWGSLQNFNCGFSALPDFIGSKLEGWCANIIEWLAGKVQLHLKDDIDKLLLDLIYTHLDIPTTTTTTPQPGHRSCSDTRRNGCTAHPIDWYQRDCNTHGSGYRYVGWEHCDTVFSARYICRRDWTCTQHHGAADCCR